MPRIGMNPSRGKMSDYRPSRVTLAMLTFIPDMSGYFQHRFDVVRLSLESLIAHSPPGTDLLVFDNGSCKEVVDYLRAKRDAAEINYLILSSRNVGKIGAFQILFRAAPGEIVAYTDDDTLFLPGWLEACMEIVDTYPNVGVVSPFYIRTHRAGIKSTLDFLNRPDVEVNRGLLISEDLVRNYADNMGRDADKYLADTQRLQDIEVVYKGVRSFVSAHHLHFVAKKQAIIDALPKTWGGQLMGQMKELDIETDRLGYLRLSTRQAYTRLLGNVISEENARLAHSHGLDLRSTVPNSRQAGGMKGIYRHPFVHRIAQGLYNRLYRIINA